jgi:molecular chaperone HtpG
VTQAIRQGCTKRVLSMLEKMAKKDAEQYQSFYDEFGNVLKEGPAEDAANKEKIAGLLRFASSHNDGNEQTVSLADYISRMQEGQDKIYFVTADSYQTARTSPHLEMFRKKGIEVLLLGERIDEWLMSHLNEFDGKTLQSAASSSADLSDLDDDETKKAKEEAEKAIEGVLTRMKTALGDKVEDVKFTHRLTDSPACIVATDDGMTTQMAKLMQAAGQPVPEPKYNFELNPEHQLVKLVSDVQDEAQFTQWTQVLFDQAALSEQGSLKEPADFVKNLNALLTSLVK